MMSDPCFIERLSATADASVLFKEFHDAERFGMLCRECPGYGRSWLCPPLSDESCASLRQYRHVAVRGLRITPSHDCALSGAELLQHVRKDFEKELLELETQFDGYACGFSGACPYCGDMPCARISGEPCRHPSLARPSLEAFGFDVSAISSHCLGSEIKWEQNGRRAEYYMLVGAVFY